MNRHFLREAIQLSVEKMKQGAGGPFGAVVVKDGRVIGRGWNCVTSSNDPTAHAEIMAIREACAALETCHLSGCAIYCSCEPCPMCLAAIYWAHISNVYFAASRQDAAEAGFSDDHILHEVQQDWLTRELAAEQDLQDEAREAFILWREKADRQMY